MADVRLNRISIILAEFNFSQKDLADFLSVNENTVSRWCNNKTQPEIRTMYKIADFFRINHQYLYEATSWENNDAEPPYKIYMANKNKNQSR